jgi:hypothetical protein
MSGVERARGGGGQIGDESAVHELPPLASVTGTYQPGTAQLARMAKAASPSSRMTTR